ncbi:MAG TPA: 30S ribosome-binding factor RbfA [Candidatus Krumholzibacteria bacterium]|nr:30S ribosome-binding factor RbfA [Candidatus Krumholzibacteria bacterium]
MGRDGHLEETLRRVLAATLAQAVDDPRVGFVTVSEVRLNRDRTVAEVFYTVLGGDEERRTSLAGLKRARGFLRQAVGENTRLRQVPELRFRYDESLDRSFRVEELLDRIHRGDESEAGEDPGGNEEGGNDEDGKA